MGFRAQRGYVKRMAINAGEQLETERRRVGLDLADLWLSYFGLGGAAKPDEVQAYLQGAITFSTREHDVLAQAINDHSIDLGLNHPAPYADRATGSGASGEDGDGSTAS